MILKIGLLAILAAVVATFDPETDYYRVCYYTNWSQYRPGDGKFFPENIDTALCSHLVYAFATMDGNRLAPFEWNDESTDWMVGMYERFNNLKRLNPDLKTLLAVGGWTFDLKKMTAMLATEENRKEFIETSIEYLRLRNFDGIDLDFEYPGSRGSIPEDKFRFTFLVQEMKLAFEKEALETGKERLLLSAAVAGGIDKIIRGYEIDKIGPLFDFVNIMSYDFFGAWDMETGIHSPLYGREGLTGNKTYYNVDFSVNYWHQNGLPKNKLVMGIPMFGRGWTLLSEDEEEVPVGSRARGPSAAGDYTREAGILAYYEMCDALLGNYPEVKRRWHPEHQAPYAWLNDQWVGYDDTESIYLKVEYLKNNSFAGWMMWALDQDDFLGIECGGTQYPLLRSLNQALIGGIPSTPATTGPPLSSPVNPTGVSTPDTFPPSPETTTNGPSTTFPPDGDFCEGKDSGIYPHPTICSKFYMCSNGNGSIRDCSSGTIFDPEKNICNWPNQVDRDYACSVCGLNC